MQQTRQAGSIADRPEAPSRAEAPLGGDWNPSIKMTQPVKLPTPSRGPGGKRLDGFTEEFLFQNIPAMIWIKDHSGVFLKVNRWAAKAMGLSEDQIVGKSDALLAGERAAFYRETDCEVIESGKPRYGLIEPLRTGQGTDIWLLTDKIPIIDRAGIVRGIAVVARDITRQREAEEELVESQERLELALWGANMGCWDWTVEDRALHFDERAAALLMFTGRDLGEPAMGLADQIHPDDVPGLLKAYDDHIACRVHALEAECRVRTGGDGPVTGEEGYRWFQFKGRVVAWNELGEPSRLSGTVLDITARRAIQEEKRELERQMQHAQKLESLGVLAGGIAHDFNNLLTGILSQTGIARMELASKSDPRDEHLRKIESAAVRMAELTKQMLAYSGRGTYESTCFKVNAVIEEIVGLLKVSVNKKARFELELSDEQPAMAGDAAQVHQILLNLITNASDALGDDGGTITLRTGWRNLSEEDLKEMPWSHELEPGRFIYVEVEDDGCGMDEETRARLFEPFFTTKFQGRGLGLSAVLGIVRSHRGSIHVKTGVEAGTIFTVCMPSCEVVTPVPARPPARTKERTSPDGQGRVLIIDDEEVVRTVCSQAIQSFGLDVVQANDGPNAIGLLKEAAAESRDGTGEGHGVTGYTGIFLDMTMPVMNGREVYERLRQIDAEVPVCIMSGYSEEEISSLFADAHICGFLPKPFQLHDIEAAIERMRSRDCLRGEGG